MSLDAETEARIKEEREADENEKFLDEQERCWCVQYIDRIAALESALGELVEAERWLDQTEETSLWVSEAFLTEDDDDDDRYWNAGLEIARTNDKALSDVKMAVASAEAALRKAQ